MTFPPIDPYKAAIHAINLGEPEIALPLAILALVDELRRDQPEHMAPINLGPMSFEATT